jgi:hypothetical protein
LASVVSAARPHAKRARQNVRGEGAWSKSLRSDGRDRGRSARRRVGWARKPLAEGRGRNRNSDRRPCERRTARHPSSPENPLRPELPPRPGDPGRNPRLLLGPHSRPPRSDPGQRLAALPPAHINPNHPSEMMPLDHPLNRPQKDKPLPLQNRGQSPSGHHTPPGGSIFTCRKGVTFQPTLTVYCTTALRSDLRTCDRDPRGPIVPRWRLTALVLYDSSRHHLNEGLGGSPLP